MARNMLKILSYCLSVIIVSFNRSLTQYTCGALGCNLTFNLSHCIHNVFILFPEDS